MRIRSIGELQQEGESDEEVLAVGELVGFVNGLVMRESDKEVLTVRELVGFVNGLSVGESVGFDERLAVGESDKELSVGGSVNKDKIGGLR
jgi:hypothetical protein